jgi:hypothetical protein
LLALRQDLDAPQGSAEGVSRFALYIGVLAVGVAVGAGVLKGATDWLTILTVGIASGCLGFQLGLIEMRRLVSRWPDSGQQKKAPFGTKAERDRSL